MNPTAETEILRFAATARAPRLARRRLRAVCADLDADQRAVAELLTTELVTNAVQHPRGRGAADPSEIEVRLVRGDRVLRVEVWDRDQTALPRLREPSGPPEGGMGLRLVATLASRWGSDTALLRHGKAVWFELEIPAVRRQ